jgi:hypothetical protein
MVGHVSGGLVRPPCVLKDLIFAAETLLQINDHMRSLGVHFVKALEEPTRNSHTEVGVHGGPPKDALGGRWSQIACEGLCWVRQGGSAQVSHFSLTSVAKL